ncbi:hypothetical protein [Priestia megaterium]|uniref:hypothetical protein n=1 Tax=Priestia megaterium TaxID=1404 RepID=UPI000D50FF1F|nr:hypothetical protein [Priestia megaterium]PVE74434.1 hypothetical protein DC428_00560 [Priestia megaterium]PVE82369.1 hypothetical protein DC421_19750 [Priestia megaterium]PVE86955.1 hypothetical protein DC426_16755 [Priestia megaterium]PVE97896.1 hypothetical protein DC433_17425 [Priestia megaterium]
MKKLLMSLALLLTVCIVTACSDGAEKSKSKTEKIKITKTAINEAVEQTKEDPLVEDAAVSLKDEKISMAVIVNSATNKEKAKEIGDNFVRQLGSFADGKVPTKDYYGEIYDQYDLLISVGNSAQDIIISGAKVKEASKITW